jgi:hypothetical protein
LRSLRGEAGRALRRRRTLYGLAAEFSAAADLSTFDACWRVLRERFGEDVWADTQEQLLHRLPLGAENDAPTVLVGTRSGVVDAREASDLIAKLSGKAYWRKLFIRREGNNVAEARELVRSFAAKPSPQQRRLF